MDIATKVNIVLCISSFLLAAISVITVIVTLKQNSVMLENASRPYVVVYGDIIDCAGPIFYLVIKNFGKSNAIITSLECNIDLERFSIAEGIKPFSHVSNTSIAPGQTYTCTLDQLRLFNSGIPAINFKVTYKWNNKIYSDLFSVNLKNLTDLINAKSSVKNSNELQIMAYAFQELLRKLL